MQDEGAGDSLDVFVLSQSISTEANEEETVQELKRRLEYYEEGTTSWKDSHDAWRTFCEQRDGSESTSYTNKRPGEEKYKHSTEKKILRVAKQEIISFPMSLLRLKRSAKETNKLSKHVEEK